MNLLRVSFKIRRKDAKEDRNEDRVAIDKGLEAAAWKMQGCITYLEDYLANKNEKIYN